ncbi:MAG: zinc transporter ZupT [Tannerella sp.]|jgi:ZIP family zinc transporter|nr:zinc transporter ZupT [Tannerella sp.]
MQEHHVWLAFGLTAVAGLATGVGSAISLLAKRTNTKFLCASLGFSAGVMLFVSFVDIIPIAKTELIQELGNKLGFMTLLLSFFGGMGLIMLIDLLVSEPNNPHEMLGVEDMDKDDIDNKRLRRVGIVVSLSLIIHNFPEGIATFTAAVSSGLEIAIPITFAIAIHNIPEGIAVAVPIYHSTGNKRKAFWLSFMSGLTEPFGALMAYFFLMPYWSPSLNGIIMAAVAGIMVYIALDELLPSAEKYGEHHISIMGLIVGMIVMALSLYLFL